MVSMVVAAMFREIFQQEGHKFPPVHVLTFNLVPLRLKNRRTKFKAAYKTAKTTILA